MTERLAYRAREVAALLGVTVVQVQRWIARGDIPAKKVGGLWFVRAATLDALLEGYDGDRERAQRGEPVPAQGRPLGGGGDDGGRPAVTIRKVEGRGAGASPRTAPAARRTGSGGSAERPRWTVPPEVAG